jgi:hypothetical protein
MSASTVPGDSVHNAALSTVLDDVAASPAPRNAAVHSSAPIWSRYNAAVSITIA